MTRPVIEEGRAHLEVVLLRGLADEALDDGELQGVLRVAEKGAQSLPALDDMGRVLRTGAPSSHWER